jgi:hypothetical protein
MRHSIRLSAPPRMYLPSHFRNDDESVVAQPTSIRSACPTTSSGCQSMIIASQRDDRDRWTMVVMIPS